MKPDILTKLAAELGEPIGSERQVVDIMVELRKLIELNGDGAQYKALKFHCDWVSELLCPRNWPSLRNRATPWRAGRWRWPTQPTRSRTAQHGASGRERVADSGMSQDQSFTCVRHGGGQRRAHSGGQ
jgi:hypothetical protein